MRQGLLFVLDLGSDADMTGIGLALATDSTADSNHRHGAEADPVGAKQHHLDHIGAIFHAAIAPDFHPVAQPGFQQRLVGFDHPDFRWQPNIFQRMLPRSAGAAIVAGDLDDVCVGFGDPHCDHADTGHDGQLHRDPYPWIAGFQFFDELGQVFNRVNIVIVAGRNQIDALRGIAGTRHFFSDFLARQMSAFTRLGALPDLDFEQI